MQDLSYLGRPLERTIIIDTNPEHVQLQPNNAILLKPWEGQAPNRPPTKELVDLIPFLEALAINEVKDVRPVLKHYEGKHIPTAYAEAEQRLRDDMRVKWQEQKQGGRGWISYLVGSIFGSTRSDQPPEPKVVTMRRLYQQQYKVEQQYWKDNEEAIKKTIEEDKERQLAACVDIDSACRPLLICVFPSTACAASLSLAFLEAWGAHRHLSSSRSRCHVTTSLLVRTND